MTATGSGVEEGTSRKVLVGLYVRDALGVIDPSGLPRLLGTGLRDAGSADEPVNWWWQRWWMDIVDARDDRIPPAPQFAEAGERVLRQQLDDRPHVGRRRIRPGRGVTPRAARARRPLVVRPRARADRGAAHGGRAIATLRNRKDCR